MRALALAGPQAPRLTRGRGLRGVKTLEFHAANRSGPHGTSTAYVVVVGRDLAKIAKRKDGRWWLTLRGLEQRRRASFPATQRAIEAMTDRHIPTPSNPC